ncbi:MAG: glycoside hydrolase family 76 protein [Corynebacterium glucuronolyticum]|nr:glycoside hydrolase family 76 [Corynebacterium glucuronolyticum]MDD7586384.1 glycoside hydrolase family 76 protein [Mycobacteriaceae bacterium]MDY5834607.1 glycoside hydrolase family 76 protein [Corynebacterium glucuronolyticum]
MLEIWAHRADLAEAAINDRHASKVWGIPGTNLGVVAWPSASRDELFLHWHYWWQAHYLDCQIDAFKRGATNVRAKRLTRTVRGIRMRNLGPLTRNRYYDDRAWMALALGRMRGIPRVNPPASLDALEMDIIAGVDSSLGVLPWKNGASFFNVPANGPMSIMCARSGRLDLAISVADWIGRNLINDDSLVMDGVRMSMHGPDIVRDIHPYNQGTFMGAELEIALALRAMTKTPADGDNLEYAEADSADTYIPHIMLLRDLVQATATHLTSTHYVLNWPTTGGDGGLFNGILARYLADVALRLPSDSHLNRATKRLAARIVLNSAESAWRHRLEVDGLPVFSNHWDTDAQLPRNAVPATSERGTILGSTVPERDLSVQLSGWMLMEAAARVSEKYSAARV